MTSDLPYAAIPDDPDAGWNEQLLDVYRPINASGAPVVVLFHGGPDINRKDTQAVFARDLAKAGMVVFVPTWGSEIRPNLLALDVGPAKAVDYLEAWRQEGSCVVSYAVAHAHEYGGDPERLLLFGFSGGANEAGAVGFAGPEPFPGCLTETGSWSADKLVLWEGDWLLGNASYWDTFGISIPDAIAAFTPWARLSTSAPSKDVALITTDLSRATMATCGASATEGWLPVVDPTGAIPARAEAAGMLDDGCIDIGDEADLLAGAMRDAGADVTSMDMHDPESSHGAFSADDQAIVLEHMKGMLAST